MYTKIQVVFDAAEPEKLAEFWGLARATCPSRRLRVCQLGRVRSRRRDTGIGVRCAILPG